MKKNNFLQKAGAGLYLFVCRISDAVAIVEKICIGVILLFILGVLLTQIVARNLFDTGFFHVDIIARHLILWICFLGASLCTYHKRHIKIDLINRFIPNKIARWFRMGSYLFCAVICVLLARAGYIFVLDEYHYGSVVTGTVPQWIFLVIIPVSLYLMAGRFVLHVFDEMNVKE